MRKTTSDIGNKSQKNQQAEHLKDLLKEFGITSQKELDHAHAGTLEEMTIGIIIRYMLRCTII